MARDNTVRSAAAEQLAKLSPGHLPFEVFLQIARLSVTPVIEVVPLRSGSAGLEGIEILLLRRPEDDPVWGSLLHTPGTIIRATDEGLQDGLTRIIAGELGGIRASPPVFVCNCLHRQARGVELALVYWIEVEEQPQHGTFAGLSRMPDDMVKTQLDFIEAACRHYLESSRSAGA